MLELKSFKQRVEDAALQYFNEFGAKSIRVVDLLLEEYDGDTESRKAYKRCNFLLEVKYYLENLENKT